MLASSPRSRLASNRFGMTYLQELGGPVDCFNASLPHKPSQCLVSLTRLCQDPGLRRNFGDWLLSYPAGAHASTTFSEGNNLPPHVPSRPAKHALAPIPACVRKIFLKNRQAARLKNPAAHNKTAARQSQFLPGACDFSSSLLQGLFGGSCLDRQAAQSELAKKKSR